MSIKLNPKSRATYNWAKKESERLSRQIDSRAQSIRMHRGTLDQPTRFSKSAVEDAESALALLEPAQAEDTHLRDQWRDVVEQYAAAMS